MSRSIFFVFALLLVAAVASNVVVLTPSNFDSVLDGSKNVLVEFYAPWCGHCKNLAPEYEVLANSFTRSKDIVIAKVDADEHKDLGGRFGVTGFPTIFWFKKGVDHSGEPEKYNLGRTADEMIEFVEKETGARSTKPRDDTKVVKLTSSNFDDIVMDESKNVLVEFYAPWCGHCKQLKPDYETLAKAFVNEEEVVIAALDADNYKEFAQRFEVSGFPTIKFFPKDNKDGVDYNGGRSPADFTSYLNIQAGTFRLSNGNLNKDAGLIDELDDFADQYLSGDKASLLASAKAYADKQSGASAKNAKYYVRTMELIDKRGDGHVAKEIARLTKMTTGGALTQEKHDEFTKRINILTSFSGGN